MIAIGHFLDGIMMTRPMTFFYHQVLGLAYVVDKAMLYCTSFEGER